MIFSVLLALGTVFGLVWNWLEASDGDREVYLRAGVWILIGALVGGRLAYVAVHWEYFQVHRIEIPEVWLGGLAWPGALAGGLISVGLVAWVTGIPLAFLADRMLPVLAGLSVAIWLGCIFVGCAYGPEVHGWWGLPALDEWGIWKPRLPLQLISVLLTVVLFWGIGRVRDLHWGMNPGLAACLGMGGLSLILLVASILRADPYPLWNGIRLETWAALFFLGLAILSGGFIFLVDRR